MVVGELRVVVTSTITRSDEKIKNAINSMYGVYEVISGFGRKCSFDFVFFDAGLSTV